VQLENVRHAAKTIAKFAEKHQVVICHGNGPQVGLLALLASAYDKVQPYSLDTLVAESQGMIGYMLQLALHNEGIKNAVTLLTAVEVDGDDPAFSSPTKPIGPVYTKEQAMELAKEKNWDIAPDGKYYRRVVASPSPKKILELDAAKGLIKAGSTVIFCGGGGIPVIKEERGYLQGKEAVIDKDKVSALAALQLDMDLFIILTDVEAIYEHFGTPKQRAIKEISPDALDAMDFASGSMGPKVEAVSRFVKQSNKVAVIGNLAQSEALIDGSGGTRITNSAKQTTYY